MSLRPEATDGTGEAHSEIVIRVCALYPGEGWKRLGIDRARKALRGDVSIPEFAETEVRIAQAHILKSDGIELLQRLSITTWPFGEGGRINSEAMLKRMSAKMDGALDPYTLVNEQIAEADRLAIIALLKLG